MASYVYPGAHHNRFEHSIGVMYLADRFCEHLSKEYPDLLNKNDLKEIRMAGLLHDIGHGPFSHISERVLKDYSKKSDIETIHEDISVNIINNNKAIMNCLSKGEREIITDLLKGSELPSFKKEIISGNLDADKVDYLLRDSYYAGVKYGHFDEHKFIESLKIIEDGDSTYLAMDENGIFNLEQFILAKYHMTQQVYYHRIRKITDEMIVRTIKEAINEDIPEISIAFKYDGSEENIEAYLKLHDNNIFEIIKSKSKGIAKILATKLQKRELYSEIYRKRVLDIKDPLLRNKVDRIKKNTNTWENNIAERFELKPFEVIVNVIDITNPTYKTPGFNINDKTIMILEKNGERRELADIPWTILSLKHSEKKEHYLEVYLCKDDLEKELSKEDFETEINNILFRKGNI